MATLENGVEISPVATLTDGAGTVHIWIDDHCYVIGVERKRLDGTPSGQVFVAPTRHIFAEAFEVLKTLPSPANVKVSDAPDSAAPNRESKL